MIIAIFLLAAPAYTQEMPSEIINAFKEGDSGKLAAFFHKNLEIDILNKSYVTSNKQAEQIIKKFFKEYPPKSFSVNFDGTRQGSKYGLGSLITETGSFRVNIYFMESRQKKTIYFLSIDKE